MNSKPLLIQADRSIIVQMLDPLAKEAKAKIAPFCSLEKSLEFLHTYSLSNISIWNAISIGYTKDKIIDILKDYSFAQVPDSLIHFIKEMSEKYNAITFKDYSEDEFELVINSKNYQLEILAIKELGLYLRDSKYINKKYRGFYKQLLIHYNFPVHDEIGLMRGSSLKFNFKKNFKLRDYQEEAANTFLESGGFGNIILPCGSGKTVVGINVMQKLACSTLIVTTNIVALRQWINELLDKTDIDPQLIGEYSAEVKQIRAITVCTYSSLVRRKGEQNFITSDSKKFIIPTDHEKFDLFNNSNFGLMIYDEVHVLPAQVFRLVSQFQFCYRLGLTATLVREDGKQIDVFSLIGPRRYEIFWKRMQEMGFIAEAKCIEIRIKMDESERPSYATSNSREKFKIASTNKNKLEAVEKLLKRHKDDKILIIGQFIDQLQLLTETFNLPLLTGESSTKEREDLYNDFRKDKIKILAVSKIANFAIDLPDANIAIQIGGTFGSRQEEAQRLGRIIRPKNNQCIFYTLVTSFSIEVDFSLNRQKFLVEQGYNYEIKDYEDEFTL